MEVQFNLILSKLQPFHNDNHVTMKTIYHLGVSATNLFSHLGLRTCWKMSFTVIRSKPHPTAMGDFALMCVCATAVCTTIVKIFKPGDIFWKNNPHPSRGTTKQGTSSTHCPYMKCLETFKGASSKQQSSSNTFPLAFLLYQ